MVSPPAPGPATDSTYSSDPPSIELARRPASLMFSLAFASLSSFANSSSSIEVSATTFEHLQPMSSLWAATLYIAFLKAGIMRDFSGNDMPPEPDLPFGKPSKTPSQTRDAGMPIACTDANASGPAPTSAP